MGLDLLPDIVEDLIDQLQIVGVAADLGVGLVVAGFQEVVEGEDDSGECVDGELVVIVVEHILENFEECPHLFFQLTPVKTLVNELSGLQREILPDIRLGQVLDGVLTQALGEEIGFHRVSGWLGLGGG